ncbi:MAG: DUF1573 domain-containing protein [Flavobacteriales bacterium]|nr:DUF1573 domain-containing protein [Flavobacteriales bacterium]
MKKMIYLLPFFLFGKIGIAQQETALTEKKPKMVFETEVLDYGTVEQGSNGEREFHFTNNGNAPLIITEAQKTCGCTVPSFPKEPILPGASADIKVKYDTKRLGPINKSVTIISNDERPGLVLRIKGTVVAPATSPEKKDAIMQAD